MSTCVVKLGSTLVAADDGEVREPTSCARSAGRSRRSAQGASGS